MYTSMRDYAHRDKRRWLRSYRRQGLITDALMVSALGIALGLILASQI